MVLALVPAALATAACQSQPDSTQTRIDTPPLGNSVNAQIGDIRLLATRIDAPEERKVLAATSTGLFTTLANDGSQADTLVAVSTSYATRTILRDGTDGPERPVNVPVPAHGVVSLQYPGQTHIELVDLKVDVRAGRLLPVQFRFSRSGTATVNVFVDGFGLPTVSPVTPSGS